MQSNDWLQLIIYITLLIGLTPLLGTYMFKVFEGAKHPLLKPLGWLERATYKCCTIDSAHKMGWREYTAALLIFNLLGFLVVLLLQLLQQHLPFNPQHLSAVSWHSAFNTAVSFMTNTNWQGYAGEVTMSYLTQMLGLAVQNFLSAATGVAVLLALARGLRSRSGESLGNFWVDMTRTTLYLLLPLSFILAVVLVSQGVVQTFSSYVDATTLEGVKQTIPLGPAASQIAIKQLGTNGGGFFNANSAVPFENPTPISNLFEMLALLLIPAALTFTFGRMVGAPRHGWALFAVMLLLWLGGLGVSIYGEYGAHPHLAGATPWEGKEIRFGVINSLIWSTATTAASNGSVNAMHSSLSPLAGGAALFNIMLGEVIFGGVGAGLYGMLVFVLLAVFLAGLMVGRTPEYLGKKIDAPEMQMVMIAVLAPCAAILIGSAIAAILPAGLSSLANHGPHGLTEIVYAFSSAAGNNGSAFAGLNANTLFYNLMLGITMLIGRFAVIVPVLVIAGSLAKKNIAPPSSGTFPTDTPLFCILLITVILIVGALTFAPALALGPLVEHWLMLAGRTF